ncbi:MAG: helix-turn-helix transcriptional regulator [Acetobacteraceae bacterium]|nr:helix-turn-helix transcriptional regulator [Acetobacteraceae bacterium]MCX7683690.1 helix-turn-helix transcriptional regulator [Acetobacteraceae bacterium]MDW8399502.1 helix-turn-helix transcriptional regulator [Acetobacteraceae bacterium]
MALDPAEIGRRLRAHRIGAGLRPEEVAARLGISRAALYNYEKEGVTRLDLVEGIAGVLGVSVGNLLGIGTEHHGEAAVFFERLFQLEAEASRILAYFEPSSHLLASPAYAGRLALMLRESLEGDAEGLAAAERTLSALAKRRAQAGASRRDVISIVSLPGLAAMLREGLVGREGLPPEALAERRAFAAEEVAHLARLCADPPLGVAIGVLERAPPSQTFQILSGPKGTVAAASPFRLGHRPNVTLGVATITADPAAVALYERLAERLWAASLKGEAAARRLRALLG